MAPPRIEVTPEMYDALERMARERRSFTFAARELGVDRVSLARALDRAGLEEWREENYPLRNNGKEGMPATREGIRHIGAGERLEPLRVPKNLVTRMLMAPWRECDE